VELKDNNQKQTHTHLELRQVSSNLVHINQMHSSLITNIT